MYSNNILNFQESTTILNVCIKSLETYWMDHVYSVIKGVLESKINATSLQNIGPLKTAIEQKWNKIPEEFIFKACKSFQ